jgi:hypothetical protein
MANPGLLSQFSPEPGRSGEPELNLLPPDGINVPLWRSLLMNVLDRISPEKFPPLVLTSRPVDTGMLVGDMVGLPWYRTIFTNLGDVISPEVLPPLELESRPVEVGELLNDELGHGWWVSLLANLRDAITAEPALQLTARPYDPGGMNGWMQLPNWSAVIDGPKVFLPDPPSGAGWRLLPPLPFIAPKPAELDPELVLLERQLKHDLRIAHFREAVWISVFAAEVIFILMGALR